MTAINQLHTTRWSLIAQCGIIASFYLLLYGTILRGLFAESYSSHIYSYGILVPAIAGYFTWRKISELKAISFVPTLWGCVLLLVAVVLYLNADYLWHLYAQAVGISAFVPLLDDPRSLSFRERNR
jgi:hypothetical protein